MRAGVREPAASPDDGAVWPIVPDPALTNLTAPQFWRLSGGRAVCVEVGGARLAAADLRIAALGVRRDVAGRPWPATFAHCPETGAALALAGPAPPPDILDIDPDSGVEVPLAGGLPAPAVAGRPAALYLFHENLGALDAWDGRAFSGIGRLPPAGPIPGLAAGPHGLAYAAADGLVAVPLPQLGPGLASATARMPGLEPRSAPALRGREMRAVAAFAGRLVLCRAAAAGEAPALDDLGREAGAERFAGPWTNRLGDAFWTGPAGFAASPAGEGRAAFVPWPEGFEALPDAPPWRDRADVFHQIGLRGGRYHYAALSPGAAPRRLDGPHLAAGGATYAGGERFDVPWQEPTEALSLGAHTGSLLVPLLAMARDTLLLALPIEGPRGAFLRGQPLPAPIDGVVLHHAHGAGLRRLPVGLAVSRLGEAGALVHERRLFVWSRGERRCHALRLRP